MSVEHLKQAMQQRKTAETLENNEDRSTVGVNNVYPNPPERAAGTIDAPWGEHDVPKGGKNDAQHYGTGVEVECQQDREKLLERVFDGVPQASAADKALIAANFDHGQPGAHESHSPLLTRKTAAHHAPSAPTLVEQVRAVVGRR